MERFWNAWNKNTVVSGVLAVGLLGLVGYCVVAGKEIPDTISHGFIGLIAWFFGAKGQDETRRAVAAVRAERGE